MHGCSSPGPARLSGPPGPMPSNRGAEWSGGARSLLSSSSSSPAVAAAGASGRSVVSPRWPSTLFRSSRSRAACSSLSRFSASSSCSSMDGFGLCRGHIGVKPLLRFLMLEGSASRGERVSLGLLWRDRDDSRDLKFDMALITQRRWLIRRVNAWLTSSSLGGPIGSEQFSSALRRGSVPSFVTQGCSWSPRQLWFPSRGGSHGTQNPNGLPTLISCIFILVSGSFHISLVIRSRKCGFSSSGSSGVSVLMASYISRTPGRLKGMWPYLRQKSDTPMLQTSAARVLLRVVQDLDQRHQVRVVQLLHDGDLLADQEQRVLGLLVLLVAQLVRHGGVHARAGAGAGGGGGGRRLLMGARRSPARPAWPPAQDVGLGALAQPCLGELLDGILVAELVDGEVHGAVGAPADLFLDGVLVDEEV
ncbi:hypothetical protein VSDG_09877 [Cytospora chrysosperma]|uniref:Uncharacterized protein n=1 Tax=Cytospora chrysosperma TaxID=252740 RepID=A0A423V948_CYTCH|nr:hypothetical protein VSDG_09877 [Valsa sordida]